MTMEKCKVCGEDLYFPAIEILGRTRTMRRKCKCVREEEYRAERARIESEARYSAERARDRCFREYGDYRGSTFATDDGKDPGLSKKMRNYAANFGRFLEGGNGLLFYGNVGAGKTFYSACIANAIIDGGYTVTFSNFVSLVHRIQDETYKGLPVMREIGKCDLLIIDDLGIERETKFMQEHVYNIIDLRYRNRKPVIVSTNLTGPELQNPSGVMASRIYGRILERCLPIRFDGPDRRKSNTRYREMLDVLNG